ncbi:hypothetical protein VOLCADRAFT_96552 [Volvox carteri f. nagariensis]|uniref:Uncharacterized protein n=1 Tax=Volvox carteri f. nagariensis TaxID=3068 RepID=D8UAE4_VOLCA|nr:uncharacterized protein VOLCADRAFT_96552 [Volvox carteri f. nagariensis]EFJ43253.1 hypothetical protein VOLCADRAFT_96552 [Volvox carteri f. nagariensis]|eukprot:XP_002955613.1 hypothetical protein VOLCADRAFT_96552 [Volvox carteri f. nagariensis]
MQSGGCNLLYMENTLENLVHHVRRCKPGDKLLIDGWHHRHHQQNEPSCSHGFILIRRKGNPQYDLPHAYSVSRRNERRAVRAGQIFWVDGPNKRVRAKVPARPVFIPSGCHSV